MTICIIQKIGNPTKYHISPMVGGWYLTHCFAAILWMSQNNTSTPLRNNQNTVNWTHGILNSSSHVFNHNNPSICSLPHHYYKSSPPHNCPTMSYNITTTQSVDRPRTLLCPHLTDSTKSTPRATTIPILSLNNAANFHVLHSTDPTPWVQNPHGR